jgi:succinyl-diaminopimelate desuccinylase
MIEQVLETLAKLVSFKSVTPKSGGAIEYIAELLTSVGFACDIQILGETEEEKTVNLYAKYGTESPNICFAGHIDVVPPMNENLWEYDPFELKIVGEKVYGRGTVDMKGSIACAMVATLNYLKNNSKKTNGSISFLLTSDEEGCAKYGTKPMLEYLVQKDEKIHFSILGEPTTRIKLGDTIKIGRRGSVNFTLAVTGKQGHVAYPFAAVNPITSSVKIAADLINIKFDEGSEFFEKTNLEMTSFDVGNSVVNIIPEQVTLNFNVRFNNLHTAKTIFGTVLETIAKHEVIFDLQYESSSEAFIQEYSEKMKKFANIVKNQCNIVPEIETNGGTSDARFIHKYSEIVEFGLSFDQAHKINEHTKISDLQTLYNVYYTSLVEFLEK